MRRWEQVAKEFIDTCSFKDDIEAAFLTGSHAFGNADEFSDIDIYIILGDHVDWRERGNRRIGGLLVEYFANPMRQIRKYIDGGYPELNLTEINMILGGIVICNKNSAAEAAVAFCKQKMLSEFPKMSDFGIKTGLYAMWNNLDELQRVFANSSLDFSMLFYAFVRQAFELYSRYICSPVPNYHKTHQWLTDKAFRERYGLPAYNDPVFLDVMKQIFDNVDAKVNLALAQGIYSYIADKMGGINIDDFALRSPCAM